MESTSEGALKNPISPALHFLKKGRIPCLDGWRGISILFVLLHHNRWIDGHPELFEGAFFRGSGALGVRCFFIISGFLITLLLLREADRDGKPAIARFFLRRSLRIFPAYFFFLLVLFILTLMTPYQLTSREWITCLTFTRNYITGDWTTGHLWSLGVEQQFYLIWPFFFVLIAPLRRVVPSFAVLMLPLAGGTVARWLRQRMEPEPLLLGGQSFFCHMDSLAVGCVLAISAWHGGGIVAPWLIRLRWPLTILALTAMLGPLWLWNVPRPWSLLKPIWPLVQAIGFGTLLLQSVVLAKSATFRWLETKPMVFLGAISYSLYIWQQVFCTPPSVFGATPAWWNQFPFWMAASVLAAVISHMAIEKPFLSIKGKMSVVRNPRPPTP